MREGNTVPVSDLCDLVADQVDPRDRPGALYVGLSNLASGRLLRIGAGRASEVRSSKFLFRRGDTLYSKLRPYLDKAVLAQDDGTCTTELLVLRPKERVDPRLLVGVLHSRAFIQHALQGTTGAQHPRTSWSHIRDFRVPAVLHTEQEKATALVWLLHEALVACEASADAARSLKVGAMRLLFTRGLRGEAQKETEIGLMPESWSVARFGSVRLRLQYGTSVRCSNEPSPFPVLRIPNVESGGINVDSLKFGQLQTAVADRYKLEDGDLLFIRTNGVIERLGACAVYRGEPQNALFASYLIRAQIKRHRVDPAFVAHFFGSASGTALVTGRATPAADGKYNLNTAAIDDLPLPLPPTLGEQRGVAAILNAIDASTRLHFRRLYELQDLFKAVIDGLVKGSIRVADLDLSTIAGRVAKQGPGVVA